MKRFGWLVIASSALSMSCAVTPDDDGTGSDSFGAQAVPNAAEGVRWMRDTLTEAASGVSVGVEVAVQNLGYEKHVGVHYSVDGGPWRDVEGRYVARGVGTTEAWRVELTPGRTWTAVEYAVFYRDPSSGRVFWDNNRGANFRVEREAPVHRADDALSGNTFTIDVDVKNLAYQKACQATVTGDGWMSTSNAMGAYVGPAARAGYERWRFTLDGAVYGSSFVSRAAVIEYALSCTFGNGESTHADNNRGQNYRWSRGPAPVERWRGVSQRRRRRRRPRRTRVRRVVRRRLGAAVDHGLCGRRALRVHARARRRCAERRVLRGDGGSAREAQRRHGHAMGRARRRRTHAMGPHRRPPHHGHARLG